MNVPAAGNYDINLRTATNFTTSAFHVEVDGVNVTGKIIAPYTNSWSAFQWVGKTGIALTAGIHQLKVVADQQYFNLNQIQVLASGSGGTTSGGGGTTTGGTGGTTGGATGGTPPSSLLFWSGFDGSIAPGAPYDCWGNGCWQDMTGTDSVTGFAWPPQLNGGSGRFQQIANPPTSNPANTSNIGSYMSNAITTVTGHKGSSTRALLSTIYMSGCCGTGSINTANGSTQDPFIIFPSTDVKELYISQWIMMQPDMLAKLGPNNWREVFEWKSSDQDFRMQVAIKTDSSGKPYWMTSADADVPTATEFWRINNTSVPVPQGQWFKVEVYWKRSTGSDGRIWAAINGNVIADRYGSTYGGNMSPVNRVFMTQIYSGSTYPIYQYHDDIQVWSTFPTAGSTNAWYDPPYAPH